MSTKRKVERIRESLGNRSIFSKQEEFLFIEPNDYCTVRYQGYGASLKSTRGLHYLAVLLRDPGREFHVTELLAHPWSAPSPGPGVPAPEGGVGGLFSGFPVLDAQAKAEYKRRINELRHELEEAERFNDTQRKTGIQSELQVLCENLAGAIGLGGRDRTISSDAERARSAVTKCIRKAIQKIGEAIPSLGYHFAVSIRTGYFCSYNPPSDHPVSWKFYLELLISLALCVSSRPQCAL